jgi:predicted GNAT family N-acyltransferase
MKPQLSQVEITQVTWQEAENYLRAVRTPVFIVEQLVTPEFEWDELDASAVHLLAVLNNEPVGCLRIINFMKIGRMAVLKEYRGIGVGRALLAAAIEICKLQSSKSIILSAQTHAIGFYQRCGFQVTSEVYQDLHIPHVDMQMALD